MIQGWSWKISSICTYLKFCESSRALAQKSNTWISIHFCFSLRPWQTFVDAGSNSNCLIGLIWDLDDQSHKELRESSEHPPQHHPQISAAQLRWKQVSAHSIWSQEAKWRQISTNGIVQSTFLWCWKGVALMPMHWVTWFWDYVNSSFKCQWLFNIQAGLIWIVLYW